MGVVGEGKKNYSHMMKQISPLFVLTLTAAAALSAQQLSGAFFDTFEGVAPTHFTYDSGGKRNPLTHESGVASSLESETDVVRLTMDTADAAGAWQGPNFTSRKLCHYGTYAARLKIPSSAEQPRVGGVVGFYTYFNDTYGSGQEKDLNGNGLPDNSEIDFEWLIADPTVLYLTAFTDYDDATGETRKVGRVLNLAQGKIYSTIYAERLGVSGTPLAGLENAPESIAPIPGFDASARFYTYGFDWHPDQIRWWILHPTENDTVVLWDYRGPQERITQKPAYLMFNFWHTNDWSVQTVPGSTQKPQFPFSVEFDWVSYTPMGTTSLQHRSIAKEKRVSLLQSNRERSSWRIPRGSQKVELYNLLGELLVTKSIVADEMELQLEHGAPLRPGHYWAKWSGQWGSEVFPFSLTL